MDWLLYDRDPVMKELTHVTTMFQFYTSWKSIARQIFSWMTFEKQSLPKCNLKNRTH